IGGEVSGAAGPHLSPTVAKPQVRHGGTVPEPRTTGAVYEAVGDTGLRAPPGSSRASLATSSREAAGPSRPSSSLSTWSRQVTNKTCDCCDPAERHFQCRRVVREVEQVIAPAARVGHRPG